MFRVVGGTVRVLVLVAALGVRRGRRSGDDDPVDDGDDTPDDTDENDDAVEVVDPDDAASDPGNEECGAVDPLRDLKILKAPCRP